MSDRPDRPSPGPDDLVVPAVFVPDGEQPPPEFASMWDPLRIPATLDPATGQITCDNAGTNFGGDILARWYPDEEQGSDTELSPDDTGDNAWELANAGPGGSDSRGGQDRGG